MDRNHVEEHIRSLIVVGWRKGVDGCGSARIWRALNTPLFGDDKAAAEAASEHIELVTQAALATIEDIENIDVQKMADAMKEAALTFSPNKKGESSTTPGVQGIEIIKSLLPLVYERYGGKWKYMLNERGELIEMRERDGEWSFFRYVPEEALQLCATLLLKMTEDVPQLQEKFSEQLAVDGETVTRREIYEATREVTDEGWLAHASWIQYCLTSYD